MGEQGIIKTTNLELLAAAIIYAHRGIISTYDHRSVKTGHPVRSAIHKH
jgi:hypothetical protein